ncbi:MAG: TOBE domain-containing protein, partial [Candidatus Altiarchaeota archaeon]|nr:TOBE domain-containing protein [Candidatus Altiarchaeota archaeon]
VSIRPEDILLSKDACEDGGMNVLRGRITEVLDGGILIRVIVDVGIPLSVLLTRSAYLEKKLGKGDNVCLTFKAMDVHVF